jgi:hypothetical protein
MENPCQNFYKPKLGVGLVGCEQKVLHTEQVSGKSSDG